VLVSCALHTGVFLVLASPSHHTPHHQPSTPHLDTGTSGSHVSGLPDASDVLHDWHTRLPTMQSCGGRSRSSSSRRRRRGSCSTSQSRCGRPPSPPSLVAPLSVSPSHLRHRLFGTHRLVWHAPISEPDFAPHTHIHTLTYHHHILPTAAAEAATTMWDGVVEPAKTTIPSFMQKKKAKTGPADAAPATGARASAGASAGAGAAVVTGAPELIIQEQRVEISPPMGAHVAAFDEVCGPFCRRQRFCTQRSCAWREHACCYRQHTCTC
jgi:hypothetical protein